MAYGETKVYFDGSHYIAIPHTERPKRYRPKPVEEKITVADDNEGSETVKATEPLISPVSDGNDDTEQLLTDTPKSEPQAAIPAPKNERQMTRKELFEELYKKYIDLPRAERHYKVMDGMEHTEESFKKALQTCLRNLCYRKEWKYMGVWERSPEKQRLHFHGLFYIPENAMVGELFEKTDYDLRNHRMRTTVQNTFFNKKYGRSDFEEILPIENNLERELSYLMKYIEKSGEKIVYSKGLFQYFISDIMDEDIVSTIGQEEKKLLLFDDFNCWDEGLYMGKVSSEVIAQMRKCN